MNRTGRASSQEHKSEPDEVRVKRLASRSSGGGVGGPFSGRPFVSGQLQKQKRSARACVCVDEWPTVHVLHELAQLSVSQGHVVMGHHHWQRGSGSPGEATLTYRSWPVHSPDGAWLPN